MDKKIIDPLLINEFVQNSKPIDISDIKVVETFLYFQYQHLLGGTASFGATKKSFCFDTLCYPEWPSVAAIELKKVFCI